MRKSNHERWQSGIQPYLAVSARAFATLIVIIAMNSSVALAEGFPGIGDRLLYADALPHYNLGNKYLAKQWYEKAVEKYWDAIGIYEHDADVYVNLSVAYRKLGNIPEAENASRKAVQLKPEDWTSWSNLANMLMTQDKFPESYKCFNKALKCPGIPDAEKTFIESNIDGMKKIMKARGLTIDGREIASPAVPLVSASKKRGSKIASKKISTAGTVPTKAKATTHPNQLAGTKESEIDSNAYDQWLGNK